MANALDAHPYPGDAESVLDRAFDWVGNALSQSEQTPDPKKLNPEWKRFWGTYRSIWSDIFVFEIDAHLAFVEINSVDPMGTLAKLDPGDAANKFKVADGNPFVFLGESVQFSEDDKGQVTAVRIGAAVFRRIR